MEQIQATVESAKYKEGGGGPFVHLVLSDGTEGGIYLQDGSPRNLLHDLLDAWIAAGNVITPAES